MGCCANCNEKKSDLQLKESYVAERIGHVTRKYQRVTRANTNIGQACEHPVSSSSAPTVQDQHWRRSRARSYAFSCPNFEALIPREWQCRLELKQWWSRTSRVIAARHSMTRIGCMRPARQPLRERARMTCTNICTAEKRGREGGREGGRVGARSAKMTMHLCRCGQEK